MLLGSQLCSGSLDTHRLLSALAKPFPALLEAHSGAKAGLLLGARLTSVALAVQRLLQHGIGRADAADCELLFEVKLSQQSLHVLQAAVLVVRPAGLELSQVTIE